MKWGKGRGGTGSGQAAGRWGERGTRVTVGVGVGGRLSLGGGPMPVLQCRSERSLWDPVSADEMGRVIAEGGKGVWAADSTTATTTTIMSYLILCYCPPLCPSTSSRTQCNGAIASLKPQRVQASVCLFDPHYNMPCKNARFVTAC